MGGGSLWVDPGRETKIRMENYELQG
jgi:hypothetical protein